MADAIDTISIDGAHCRRCAYKCRDCDRVIVEGQDFSAAPPDDPYHSKDSLCEECYSTARYDHAIESWDLDQLIESLGYARRSYVREWFSNRHSTQVSADTLDLAQQEGWVEVEGESLVYRVPNRYGKEFADRPDQRKARARILWALRGVVNS